MRRALFLTVLALGLVVATGLVFIDRHRPGSGGPPIRVGVLHSLSGPMAVSEQPVVEATLLAIEELNAAGGVLGRRLEPLVVDGRSDDLAFAQQAEKLIAEEGVSVIFGCWTSASRKAVRTVVEAHDHLLFYPVQYEGMEESANIVYTGAAPNQQIIPAVNWVFANLGKRVFLVGSDYVFPRAASEIIRDLAGVAGGEIVGEEYPLLEQTDFSGIVARIKEARPQVILNAINGEANRAFLEALYEETEFMRDIPVMSFSLTESEMALFKEKAGGQGAGEGLLSQTAGGYACWNYFQSVDTPENRHFVARFKEKYGDGRVIGDPMAAAYAGVHLWAGAAAAALSEQPGLVLQNLPGLGVRGPQGYIVVDQRNNHTWKKVRIGRIRENGQFEIVWETERLVRPVSFPLSRSKSEWNRFLAGLQEQWGGQWRNQGPR